MQFLGRSVGFGGCVINLGTFACKDCVFDKCSSGVARAPFLCPAGALLRLTPPARAQDGGGVFSFDTATLKLVRPTFIDGTCKPPLPCGSGCACGGVDPSKCVGCTCQKHPSGDGFYCDATTTVCLPPCSRQD